MREKVAGKTVPSLLYMKTTLKFMVGVRAGKLTGIGLLLLQLLPGTESFSGSVAFCSTAAKQRTATFALRGRDPCAATSRHRNGLLGMAACAMKAPAGKIKGVLFDIDGTLFDSGGRSVLQFLLFA